ncbi:DedA family protein [Arthrobacter cryoconiti]|uniref:DedA family protein n=1 Tax=Arthrobacter cryoconiti TaxID=748907 RepID=A0ABV8R051_9MICC|nr:VTT domain-containing protein [Arthrobacter cryoconiti]MCC9068479.1 VTT domain-containing protein [Arthrobacter cryoconiti]
MVHFAPGGSQLVMESIASLPFLWAYVILFCIVMLRSNATYWAGRGIAAGGRKTRMQRYLDSPAVARAEQSIARWGAPAVSVSFLTIGFQTAVNLAAGFGRMPLRRYIPATVVGAMAWAGIYATIGLAAFDAAIAAAAGSPWALAILLLTVGAALLAIHLIRVSRRRKLDVAALNDCPVMNPEAAASPSVINP